MKKTLLFLAIFCSYCLTNTIAQPVQQTDFCKGGVLDTNVVINGDFNAGNTGFTTTYNYCNSANCLFPLIDNGYSIGTDASYFHIDFSGADHTTGTGNFMLINGQDTTLTPWQQTVTVQPGNTYVFSMWMSSMDTLPYHGSAIIKVLINGIVVIDSMRAPDSLNTWIQFTTPWNSGASTSAAITIKDCIADWGGFDYGLDDISLRKCTDTATNTNRTIVAANGLTNKIVLQPNPSNGNFRITNVPYGAQVAVYNMLGVKIPLAGNVSTLSASEINMADQPDGVYLVRIVSASSEVLCSERMVVAR